MDILMISPKVSGIGGVARHVTALIKRLRKKGFLVDIISTENTLHLPVKGLYNLSFSATSTLKTLRWCLRGKHYDVAHGHNLPTWLGVKLAPASVKILTQHGIYSESIQLLYGNLAGSVAKRLELAAVKRMNALTCVSGPVYKYYKEMGARARFIPNAIDFQELPGEKLRLFEKQVVYAGRLSYEKGFDMLLEAAEFLDPRVHVVVLGSGLKKLEERAHVLSEKLLNFHYLGYRSHEETLKIIAGSDLLVLPSRAEGLPTVILEAMALKVPILASRIPGVTDVLDESCAALVELGEPAALAKAINRFVEDYPREMLERAYTRVKEKFNWDVIAEEYVKLYEELLTEKTNQI
ncbi:MAG: glycosyltransferase family 4 protein [Thermofilaceae archaeon]